VNAGSYPSFLAVDPTRRFLYAVLEGSAEVAAFAIDRTTGGLTPLNQVPSGGNSPAHVAVDQRGGFVMVANYSGGSVRVLPIQPDGSLGTPSDTESPGTNPHLILTDRTNRFAYVPCKGSDLVAQYAFDEESGTLTPMSPASVATASGAGPRHLAFHPTGEYAYLINELDDTMTALRYDTSGLLTPLHTLSTLPSGTSGNGNTTAEVAVHPRGNFVYGSNRGHDSIVVYSVDGLTGRLTLVGHDSSGGETPRHFSIEEAGEVMLVANRDTNNVVVFDIDQTTGRLTQASEVTGVERPEYAAIVTLPGS
jgi:6-phosphogluconolactonase